MKKSTKKTPESRQRAIFGLAVAAVAVVTASLLFVGAVSGWFSGGKVSLSPEYLGKSEMIDIDLTEYKELVKQKKTFIVGTYSSVCTASILDFLEDFAEEKQITLFYLPWSDIKEDQELKEILQYPPTVFVISGEQVVAHLRADSDEDTDKYNDQDAFNAWLEEIVQF